MGQADSTQSAHRVVLLDSPIPGFPYVAIHAVGEGVSEIDLLQEKVASTVSVTGQAVRVAELIRAYFDDAHIAVPPQHPLSGTPFQQRVWLALQRIPPGETRTYGALARELSSSPRAVAAACRANPIPILIPCHRVVSASGLGGYMGKLTGPEVEIKRWLLQHEGYV